MGIKLFGLEFQLTSALIALIQMGQTIKNYLPF